MPINTLLLHAPRSQQHRAALIHRAIAEKSYAAATYSLIMAAVDTRSSEWSEQCAALAETTLHQIDQANSQEQSAFIVALLDLHGKRIGADRIDIDAAAILANTYLSCGSSASGALSEGYKLLRHAI